MSELYITYCSARKKSGIHNPDKLYLSGRIDRFIAKCKEKKLRWAILSAKYGLFFPYQKRRKYNITMRSVPSFWLGLKIFNNNKPLPKNKSKNHVLNLAKEILERLKEHQITKVVCYCPSTKRAKSYLSLLHYTLDKCERLHKWDELREHISNSQKLEIVNKIRNIK